METPLKAAPTMATVRDLLEQQSKMEQGCLSLRTQDWTESENG